jgi:hypothetical protein
MDGMTRLWTLRPSELIEIACRTASRNLRRDEWAQYMPANET